MSLKVKIFTFFFFLYSGQALSCPGCAGSMENPIDKWYVIIISIFILLCYIPLSLIFKTFHKYRNINALPETESVKE